MNRTEQPGEQIRSGCSGYAHKDELAERTHPYPVGHMLDSKHQDADDKHYGILQEVGRLDFYGEHNPVVLRTCSLLKQVCRISGPEQSGKPSGCQDMSVRKMGV